MKSLITLFPEIGLQEQNFDFLPSKIIALLD